MKTKIDPLLEAFLSVVTALYTARRTMVGALVMAAVPLCTVGLAQAAAQSPPNDNCSTAQPVSAGSYSGTTTGATPDPNGWLDYDPDVWLAYTASEAGTLTLDTCASLQTSLTLWTQDCDFGFPVGWGEGCEDTGGFCGASKTCLSVGVGPGTYLIRVASIGGVCDFGLNLSFAPFCPNLPSPSTQWLRQFSSLQGGDDFAQAIDGDSNYFYVGGSVGGALPGQNDLPESDAFLRKYNANGDEIWSRQFGTSSDLDVVAGIAVDASGIYVAGSVAGALPGQSHLGGRDAYLQKYDADGILLWTRQFGTANDDQAFGVAAHPTGVYVVGFADTLSGQTDVGAFVRKYDANGNEMWTRQFIVFDGLENFITPARKVVVDGTSIYVAGDFFVRKYDINGSYHWQTVMGFFNGLIIKSVMAREGCGVIVSGSATGWMDGAPEVIGGRDGWLRKLEPETGAWLWTRKFGTTGDDEVYDAKMDATGISVTGITSGTLPGQTRTGEFDPFVAKFDCDGNAVWSSQFGTPVPGAHPIASSVVNTPKGVAVVGYLWGSLPGQAFFGRNDAFIRLYSPSGEGLWTRQFGSFIEGFLGGTEDRIVGVASDGNTYVVGETMGLYPGTSTSGGVDAFVRKYGSDGTELWTRQFGPLWPRSVALDTSGVYVVGWGVVASDGQVSLGGSDAFIVKLDHAGNRLWTRQFGSSANDFPNSVCVGPSGVWIAGETSGTLPGQTASGTVDAFIARFDTEGNLLWTRQFGSAGFDSARGIASDASGVWVVGNTSPTVNEAGFVRRYDTAGNVLWNQPLPVRVYPTAVATDGSAGYVSGRNSIFGAESAFVRKFDGAGNPVWTHEFGLNPNTDTGNGATASAIAVNGSGVFAVGEKFQGRLDCQPGAGLWDCYVRKLSTGGEHLWTLQFGSVGYDRMGGISVDTMGISVGGSTPGSLVSGTFSGGSGTFVLRLSDASANRVPTANAGVDITIESCFGAVRLNGALSSDPDGNPLTYKWYEGGALIATGVSPSVALAAGAHTITLVVTDPSGASSSDTVVVRVNNFSSDAIIWHQPLARNGASEDTDPSAGRTVKYRFKRGSTVPVQIHALNCAGADVTSNANVIGQVTVFGDSNCDGAMDANATPIDFNGVGGGGGVMDKIGGHLKYNLNTMSLPTTTQCYILRVTVTDTSTGEEKFEEVLLQAK